MAAISFAYDAAYGRVISRTDGIGETKFSYHPLSPARPGAGELAEISVPVAGVPGMTDTISYDYDAIGRSIGQSLNGSEEHADYDQLGRVSAIRNDLDQFSLQYANATTRVREFVAAHGPRAVLEYYAAQAGGQLRQMQVKKANGKPLAAFGYRYNARGNIVAFAESYLVQALPQFDKVAGAGSLLPPTAASGASGDRSQPGPPTNPGFVLLWMAFALLATLALTRRRLRVLLPLLVPVLLGGSCSEAQLGSKNSGSARLTRYDYDATHRLTSALVTRTVPTAAAIDGKVAGLSAALVGDEASYHYAYDASSNLTAIDAAGERRELSYDAANRLRQGSYDPDGNPTELDGAAYEWDANNRLVRRSAGQDGSEFTYDGSGRLVRVAERSGDRLIADHAYTWCGARRCLERDLTQPGAHIGSIRQLIDETGRVRAQYDYDPYGRATKESGDLDSDIGYAGYSRHAASGLSFALHRAYDPTHGRWLNRDPVGEASDLNLYAYLGGDPVDGSDPLGLWAGVDDAVATGVGALSGLVGQGIADAISGELSGWQDYTAAAVGGAAGGEAFLYGGPIAAGAVTGAVTNATRQGLNIASGRQCEFSFTNLAIETGVGAVGGAVGKQLGKFVPGLAAKATANSNVKVLGRLADTAVAKEWAGHEVFDIADWPLEKNAQWVASGIEAHQNFYLASPLERNLVQDSGAFKGQPTVYALELEQLAKAGYKRIGDYLVHPANLVNFQ